MMTNMDTFKERAEICAGNADTVNTGNIKGKYVRKQIRTGH